MAGGFLDPFFLFAGAGAAIPTALTVQLQMQFTSGVWTNVWGDTRTSVPVRLQYGIGGTGPADRVADTGTLTFALDNSEANSAGLLGYYAPGHANARSGFEVGIPVRLHIAYSGTAYFKFVGTLVDITPEAGQKRGRRTFCTAVDWMDEAANQRIRLLPTQVDQRGDQLVTTILANMTKQPTATSLATGQDTFPYALDNSRDERFTPLTEFQRIAMSELGFIFVKGDTSTGGVLVFQDRHARPSSGAAAYTLNDTMVELRASRTRDKVYNRVKVATHPRVVDAAATTVLYTLTGTPLVAAGATINIQGQYRDPNQRALRVGGKEMVAATATTDYTMNSAADGSGSNLTANFTVTATYGGNSVSYAVANTGATAGYITLLQARGKGVYDYAPLIAEAIDSTSRTAYGENVLEVDMPMQEELEVGQNAADYLVQAWGSPLTLVDTVEFWANASDALTLAALGAEPSTRVTLTETATGVDRDFFINGISLTITAPDFIRAAWKVTPTDPWGVWLLGITGASELGETTRLGY
jgi:hypothetical protein